MPKPITQNALCYGGNQPRSAPGQTFTPAPDLRCGEQADKVKRKEGKQRERGI